MRGTMKVSKKGRKKGGKKELIVCFYTAERRCSSDAHRRAYCAWSVRELVPLVVVSREACIRFRWDESQRTIRSLNTYNSLIIT